MAIRSALHFGFLVCFIAIITAQRVTSSETSEEDEVISGGYVLPKQIFNGGKPFYVDKDPISGQFDFSSKKPAGIEPEVNEVVDPKEKIILNSSTPNIHDFLNLPVKYSSSKFVYPLVSSSYANLKYQGNNKNFISNHKNHSTINSPPPKYTLVNRANITRLHPASFPHSTTDQPPKYEPTYTQAPVVKNKYSPTKKYVTSTTIRSTFRPTNKPFVPQHTTTTTTTTTTAAPLTTKSSTTTTTERSTTTTLPTTTTTLNLATTAPQFYTTNTPIATTSSFFPTTPGNKPPQTSYNPLTTLPNLDAAEVYNSVGQKKDPSSMSLEDIFNVFSEDSFGSFQNKTDSPNYDDYQSQELPVSQPAPFAMYTTQRLPAETVPPTDLIPQVNPAKDSNNYVHYNVHQPNTNVVNYHVPSMNNIVISPDQNSTSFVIGSQQSVGSSIVVGTGEKPPTMFANNQQIHYGTVINEQLTPIQGSIDHTNAQQGPPIYMNYPSQPGNTQQNQFVAPGQQPYTQGSIVQTMQQQNEQNYHALPLAKPTSEIPQTQELLVQSNIRFPSETIINGHGSPANLNVPNGVDGGLISVGASLPANPVVFPKNEYPEKGQYNQNKEAGNPIVFQTELGATDKGEILTLNQHKMMDKKYPRLPDSLTPPNPPESHKWPHAPTRHHTSTPTNYNEFTRKPLPGLRRPNPDRPLPNILPQFRPNAKISHGHPNFNREPGNIRVSHNNGPYLNRPKSPPPPFAHRRTPLSNRYNFKGGPEPMENRRVYKVPPPFPHNVNRIYLQRQQRPPAALMLAPQKQIDSFVGERHAINAEQFFSPEQARPERLPAFEEEDFMINDPPKPLVQNESDAPNLEPVVTLQMLKSKKKFASPVFQKLYPEVSEPQPSAPAQTLQPAASGQSPVYVVYPQQPAPGHFDEVPAFPSESGEPVVFGQRGDQPPAAPIDMNKPTYNYEYENTPFSVVREQPQEPILMVKNKSQPHDEGDFPYPLEKPDPAFAEFTKQQEQHKLSPNANIEIVPRVVNRGSPAQLTNGDSPIAIAYTPTVKPNYYSNHKSDNKFSKPNLASQVIPEIQTEASMNEELDTRGQHFEKDFMAPFYPSVSLSDAAQSQQGWSVFAASTENSLNDKNSINRVDLNGEGSSATTEKFDPNRFNPELQGGFKPIYPPDYRNKQAEDSVESNEETPLEFDSSSSTTTSTATSMAPITTTTPAAAAAQSDSPTTAAEATETSTKRVKSAFETSLASLLFGDDENYDDDDPDKISDITMDS